MGNCGWRPHIESGLKLDVRRMFACHVLRPGCQSSGNWCWTDSYDGQQVGSVSYRAVLNEEVGTLTLNYSHKSREGEREAVTCTIALSSIPLHYGGRRWYMHCPYTRRRVLTLYKFGSIQHFCARTAIHPLPTYASQRISGASRIIDQRWALRRKMGDTFSDLFDKPFKPKWMRWRTFERYAARDAALSRVENGYLARLIEQLQHYGGG